MVKGLAVRAKLSARHAWPALFLLLSLPLGIFLAIRVPLGHAPDERNHALRAESLLHGAWIGQRFSLNGHPASGVWADPAMAQTVTLPEQPTDLHPEPVTAEMMRQARAVRWGTPTLIESGSIAGYMPLPYVPGALAVAATKLAGGGPATAFLAIRLANLLCFALIGAAALRIADWGQGLIAATLLLPMTLSLAASGSQDGLLIAAACVAAGCLQRAAVEQAAREKWLAGAAALLALVIAARPPYAPLAGLLLSAAVRRQVPGEFPTLRGLVAIGVLAVLPGLFWTGLEAWHVAVPARGLLAEAGTLWPGARPALFAGPNFAAQLHVLAAGPWRVLSLPLRSIGADWDLRLHEMVGVLDYLCLTLPRPLHILWCVALAASLALAGPRHALRWQDRALAASLVLLSVCGVGTALYLQWTPVGMDWVGGIQGRYFLPLLPFLTLCLPGGAAARLAWLQAAPLLVAGIDLVWLPMAVRAFYPHVP